MPPKRLDLLLGVIKAARLLGHCAEVCPDNVASNRMYPFVCNKPAGHMDEHRAHHYNWNPVIIFTMHISSVAGEWHNDTAAKEDYAAMADFIYKEKAGKGKKRARRG